MNTDSALTCPKCGESIPLTESLAAPLVAATRARYEQQLADQGKRFQAEKRSLAEQQEANERRATELETATRKQEQVVAEAVPRMESPKSSPASEKRSRNSSSPVRDNRSRMSSGRSGKLPLYRKNESTS